MKILIAFFASIIKRLERHKGVVLNLVVVLLIWGIERAVREFIFDCPCSKIVDKGEPIPELRVVYSALFIAVPALLFWIIGMVLQGNTWRCLTGWRVQHKFVYPGRSCGCFFGTLAGSAMAPTAWVMFVLLDGSILDCALSEVPRVCLDLVEDPDARDEFEAESTDNRISSQLAGLCLPGSLMLFYFVLMLIMRCCTSMPYYELQYAAKIQMLEQQAFDAALEEELQDKFKKKWQTLMRHGTKEDWIEVSEITGSGPVVDGNNVYYSPFHQWQPDPAMVKSDQQQKLNVTFTKGMPPPPLARPLPNNVEHKSRSEVKKHSKEGGGSLENAGQQLPPPTVYGDVYHMESMQNSAYIPQGYSRLPPMMPAPQYADPNQSYAQDAPRKKKKVKKSQVQDSEA